jgi:pilus assembly protein CpaE
VAALVTVVGAVDKRIEELLRASGASLTNLTVAEFEAAAAHGTVPGQVAILDLRATRRLPPSLAHLRRRQPDLAVIVVAREMDPALMLDAMRAGVAEFLAEPLAAADLESAITRLTAAHPSESRGTVLAFLGAKGGVGTTTAAVNVAIALAQARTPVLFVDLHLSHGDAAVFLAAEPRFSVVDALENVHRLDAAFFKGLITKTKSGPDLLASSDRPFIPAGIAQNVRQLVEFTSHTYPFTVLDVPRSDAAALDALDAANRIVIVANQELATVRSAARIAEALRQRYGKERVSAIVSRYDAASEIGQDDVERVMGLKLKGLIPSDYRLALQALNTGRPLMVENHSRLAASYRDLAKELSGQKKAEEAVDPPAGLFGRLLARRA